MNILIVSQWFPPEQAPFGYMMKELAEGLSSEGHSVTVITAFPNHPGGVVFGGYKKKLFLVEYIGGVKIVRVWLGTSMNRSPIMRVYTFLTFTITSSLAVLRHRKPDLIFAVFQPLSMGITLPLIAKLKQSKLVLNIQDLHPDVPIELGVVQNPLLKTMLRWLERFGYRSADALAVICESFERHCVDRGARPESVRVIPNWIDLEEIKPESRINSFRRMMKISDDHYVVLYAGTLGFVSGAEVVLDAAEKLSEFEDIQFVFVGDGPKVKELKEIASARQVSKVTFASFQPRHILSEVQAISDVSIVTLAKGKGKASVPSKVLGYMAAARPILAAVDRDSETAATIRSANCGRLVDPGDGESLAREIVFLKNNPDVSDTLAKNGRRFLDLNYSKAGVVKDYGVFFQQVID